MLSNEVADLNCVGFIKLFELINHFRVYALGKGSVLVEHEGEAAAHSCGEVAAGRSKHNDAAAGHVFAAVVADALDDRAGARVANREALAGKAAEEGTAVGCAVKDRVAGDHVGLGDEVDGIERRDREDPPREALAGVVVGVAAQRHRHAGSQPAGEALPG